MFMNSYKCKTKSFDMVKREKKTIENINTLWKNDFCEFKYVNLEFVLTAYKL